MAEAGRWGERSKIIWINVFNHQFGNAIPLEIDSQKRNSVRLSIVAAANRSRCKNKVDPMQEQTDQPYIQF